MVVGAGARSAVQRARGRPDDGLHTPFNTQLTSAFIVRSPGELFFRNGKIRCLGAAMVASLVAGRPPGCGGLWCGPVHEEEGRRGEGKVERVHERRSMSEGHEAQCVYGQAEHHKCSSGAWDEMKGGGKTRRRARTCGGRQQRQQQQREAAAALARARGAIQAGMPRGPFSMGDPPANR